jgi:uncharacterized membrane protein
MRVPSLGRAAFAAILFALGVLGLAYGAFTPVWAPVPNDAPARDALVYACAIISVACGAGLVWPRTAVHAARVLLAALVVWLVAFRVPVIVRAPGSFPAWDGGAETVVILAGAGALAIGGAGVRVARALYGAAMIAFGLAHFIYPDQTARLVPSWLPAHLAWAYATGAAFLAAGAAILTGVQARRAAALSALQMGAFTLLVWIPIVAAGSRDPSVLSELGLSGALTAAGWVIADSYRTSS